MPSLTLDEVAKIVDGKCVGDPLVKISGLSGLDQASEIGRASCRERV